MPAELKPHVEKLKAVTGTAGEDFSTFNNHGFEATMGPIRTRMNMESK
ncbi:hypothetical protein [Pseudarthrobacter sp. N5]